MEFHGTQVQEMESDSIKMIKKSVKFLFKVNLFFFITLELISSNYNELIKLHKIPNVQTGNGFIMGTNDEIAPITI